MSLWPLVDLVVARAPVPTGAWYREAAKLASLEGLTGANFPARWSGAGRRLGRDFVRLGADEAAALRVAGAPVIPEGWGLDEVGRGVLLLAGVEATLGPQRVGAVDGLFRTAEVREGQALLKALAYLPDPVTYLDIAIEAVRSNVLTVLEALICDNPYPATFMPDAAMNQMIMKALFNGLPLRRVVGLERRRNADLSRMVEAWVSERRSAGRAVPEDVNLILRG